MTHAEAFVSLVAAQASVTGWTAHDSVTYGRWLEIFARCFSSGRTDRFRVWWNRWSSSPHRKEDGSRDGRR